MVNFSKRLQVFISSTYLDLIEERQAAVEAILEAQHIPAGMELFTAGDQSQWEVIKHWIDQSDVYLLILGGRYGSIDKKTGKSYTHLEYEYALEKGIPLFSCVLRDPDKRAMNKGDINKYLERDNPAQYREFKQLVTSKMVRFWENSEQIKTSIILTLNEFQQRPNMIGWIRGDQQQDFSVLQEQINDVNFKNKALEWMLSTQSKNHQEKLVKIEDSYQQQKQQLEKSYQNKINKLQQQLNEKESRIIELQENIKQLQSSLQNPITSEIELKSEKGVDYTKLRDLLAAGKWKEADEETDHVMLQVMGKDYWVDVTGSNIDNLPCDDLRTIDQLWVHYSKGKFGFSVQKKIYVDELGGTRDYNEDIWHQFCNHVGWRKEDRYVNYEDLIFELYDTTPMAHLPRVFCVVVGLGWGKLGILGFVLLLSRVQTCNL
ncbi:MAG: GUN4 domain-containing protein [Crocosphaera sp.]|nr:GUN4 domain-containing protein [Crocosphaera sp.]